MGLVNCDIIKWPFVNVNVLPFEGEESLSVEILDSLAIV